MYLSSEAIAIVVSSHVQQKSGIVCMTAGVNRASSSVNLGAKDLITLFALLVPASGRGISVHAAWYLKTGVILASTCAAGPPFVRRGMIDHQTHRSQG